MTRERLHVPGNERRKIVVGHQDQLLIRMLARDTHEDVGLCVARMSAHVADIKSVGDVIDARSAAILPDTPYPNASR